MKFKKENGPHIKSADTTSKIMTRFLIALSPIIAFAIFKNCVIVYLYTTATLLQALNPLLMIVIAILTTFLTELLWFKFILKNDLKSSIFEATRSFSVIPGLLFALILPPNVPLWIVFLGAFITSVVKMLFGGFGNNIFNPALIGYLAITILFPSLINASTPLSNLADLNYIGNYESVVGSYGTLFNFISGSIPGAIGETSKILILISFIYLTITKTIKWIIPVTYVGTVFAITFLIGQYLGFELWYPLVHILSGGLLFAAVFIATDPVTSPLTLTGQIVYGICLGILTAIIRFLTPDLEGIVISILFMNMFVSTLDKIGVKVKYNKDTLIYVITVLFVVIVSSTLLIITNLNKYDTSMELIDKKIEIEKNK